LDFSSYNQKLEIPEKLILSEEEMKLKKDIKMNIIYKQILEDFKANSFEDWIENQLKYQDLPPGHEFTKKQKPSQEGEIKESKD
jgi:hypothetical protein